MGIIKWNSDYSVNISEVDEQHKKLIGLVNEMYDAISIGKGREVLGPVLTELVSYTGYHFTTEERLFQQYGYPDYETHKKLNDDLTARTKKLQQAFERGNKMIAVDVMLFLSDWLNVHILNEDKKYAPFLNSKGIH
jgi:hemerythrin